MEQRTKHFNANIRKHLISERNAIRLKIRLITNPFNLDFVYNRKSLEKLKEREKNLSDKLKTFK